MNRSSADRAASGEIGWLATAASGLLLGAAVCLVELVEQPLSYASMATVWGFLTSIAPMWLVLGVAWATITRWAEPRLSPPTLIPLWAVAALGFTLATNPFDAAAPIYDRTLELPNEARLSHVLWTNLFYGGLYLTGYVASRRAVRSRRILARVRQAREESAALLEESRLDAIRRQLQPRTVRDALGALRRLYARCPGQADALVDALVGFLRPAVRGLTTDAATLAGELDLARRYLRLRALVIGEIEPREAESGSPPPTCAFPPRLLMPLIESLCLAGARPTIEAGWRGDQYRVALCALGAPGEALDRRSRRMVATTAAQWRHAFESEFVIGRDRLLWTLTVPRISQSPTLETLP